MIRKLQKNAVYLLILILPILLFFVFPLSFAPLKSRIVSWSAPAIKVLSQPFIEFKKIYYYHWTFEEYKRLKKENDILKTRFVGYEEAMLENVRLNRLLDLKERFMFSSIAAEVVGRDPSYWNSSVLINKGQRSGLKVGMPVVSELGVVGKVAEVWAERAKVILITDPQFSVAALIQSTRDSGLVSGSLQGLCKMSFMDEESQVQVGDEVITSKLSYSFPENLSIGKVVEVHEDPTTATRMCLVKPAVALAQLEEVLIIVK